MKVLEKYDVIILGGGLAGLTLALQLKQADSAIKVLVIEKRSEDAPLATHKVGESTSELGAFYLRDVLGLADYMTEKQLRKYGFRFFFNPEHGDDISKRVEVGSRIDDPFPTNQLDRGILENDLVKKIIHHGVDVFLGARATEVELSSSGHSICFQKDDAFYKTEGKWLIDSTGRSGLLKRKLDLDKKMDHNINSAWFRLELDVDIDDWSDNLNWRNLVLPGRRRLATNHLMGNGYWVWIIPLISGSTSFGIVADPKFHPFETYNTFEKAMQWFEKYEPLAAKMLGKHKDKLMDFKVMKHFAFDSKQFYSSDKWAVTGESGAFMDAFYSPGTDFIAFGNTWITDLIVRDRKGEDIKLRTMVYEHAHKELLAGWILLYQNMYGLFGKTQIMLMKIIWDWASYWSVPNILFMNNGYTDINVLKKYSSASESIGRRFATLNERIQELFREWGKYEQTPLSDAHINVFDLECMRQFQMGLRKKYEPDALIEKVAENLLILEQIFAEIFRLVSNQIHCTPLDMKVDPYSMKITDSKKVLLERSESKNAFSVNEKMKIDIAKMWLIKTKSQKNEFAN